MDKMQERHTKMIKSFEKMKTEYNCNNEITGRTIWIITRMINNKPNSIVCSSWQLAFKYSVDVKEEIEKLASKYNMTIEEVLDEFNSQDGEFYIIKEIIDEDNLPI